MKRIILCTIIAAFFCAAPVFAADHKHDHSKHGPGEKAGESIRNATIEGWRFDYRLIDMTKHMKRTGMSGMKATHHIMVYIKNRHNHEVGSGKIAFLVTGPDGKRQKLMAMAMKGGFGADVDFREKGRYVIKTKAMVKGKRLTDQFRHVVR